MQIRDGLHVFGRSPDGDRSPICWWRWRACRAARRRNRPRCCARSPPISASASIRSSAELGAPWLGPRPKRWPATATGAAPATRSSGWSASPRALVAGTRPRRADGRATRAVLDWIEHTLRPAVTACGEAEMAGLLRGLDGRFVPPGPSGAPTRGRPEVLPTGRNFYSLDSRAVPTPAAWQLGLEIGLAADRSAMRRSRATIRAASRSRPGARPTCAPAATTSRRRWR